MKTNDRKYAVLYNNGMINLIKLNVSILNLKRTYAERTKFFMNFLKVFLNNLAIKSLSGVILIRVKYFF